MQVRRRGSIQHWPNNDNVYGDPLRRIVTDIIVRVVEAGIYKYWVSTSMKLCILHSRKIAIVQKLDEYYSFNLLHMQLAFYLLLMDWCLSSAL